MYKFIIITFLLLAVSFGVHSQPNHQSTIDSLKKALPVLQADARVDGLNKLCWLYILTNERDSAAHYADLALTEAKSLNYEHGMGAALIGQSKISCLFNDDFIQAEARAREALKWYENTPNQQGIEVVYDQLWNTLHAQSRYDEAINYVLKKQAY